VSDSNPDGHGDGSSFVESAVNQVVSKRFVKRQQMAWRPALAHALLQVRTAVLNEQLRSCFERWYPTLADYDRTHHIAAWGPRFGALTQVAYVGVQFFTPFCPAPPA
jgi:hypothetical protein